MPHVVDAVLIDISKVCAIRGGDDATGHGVPLIGDVGGGPGPIATPRRTGNRGQFFQGGSRSMIFSSCAVANNDLTVLRSIFTSDCSCMDMPKWGRTAKCSRPVANRTRQVQQSSEAGPSPIVKKLRFLSKAELSRTCNFYIALIAFPLCVTTFPLRVLRFTLLCAMTVFYRETP